MNPSRLIQLSCFSSLCVIALAGCSDEPSSSDVKSAIEEQISAFGMAPKDTRVHDLKILDCIAGENDPSYICNVEFGISASYGGQPETETFADTIRLIKGSEGWHIRH